MPVDPGISRDRIAAALEAWGKAGRGVLPSTCPSDELIADHVVMDAALEAIGHEARQLREGHSLRPEFWSRAVDFIGNYVHRVHRAKEEELFRALLGWGLVARGASTPLVEDHARARELTFDLCDAVGDGDWERVLRLVALYLRFMEPHMRCEESHWLEPLDRRLDAEHQETLRASFRAIDERELPGGVRTGYAETVRWLVRKTGVPDPLESSE
ncbi:MAG: hypothetical protein QNK04_19205 [Myxococcota bacterium]|nr:hypothetical protein [Myxococcota bacterium]